MWLSHLKKHVFKTETIALLYCSSLSQTTKEGLIKTDKCIVCLFVNKSLRAALLYKWNGSNRIAFLPSAPKHLQCAPSAGC